jgi:hypothetical protein
MEGQVARVPSDDDYERGDWKTNDEHAQTGFRDTKLRTSDSPTGSNF